MASPALAGRISESVWSGLSSVDIENRIVTAYKNGDYPSREEMEEFLIAYGLSRTKLPTLLGDDYIYSQDKLLSRSPSGTIFVGLRMIEIMQSMGQDGVELAYKLLTQSMRQEDADVLITIAKRAIQDITGQSSNEAYFR